MRPLAAFPETPEVRNNPQGVSGGSNVRARIAIPPKPRARPPARGQSQRAPAATTRFNAIKSVAKPAWPSAGNRKKAAPRAPRIEPSVFQAKTRALAAPACSALQAKARTAKGKLTPIQRVEGSNRHAASAALRAGRLCHSNSRSRAGSAPSAAKAGKEDSTTATCAMPKRRSARSGPPTIRAASPAPAAMPVRKLASMIAKPARLPPRSWASSLDHSTS